MGIKRNNTCQAEDRRTETVEISNTYKLNHIPTKGVAAISTFSYLIYISLVTAIISIIIY